MVLISSGCFFPFVLIPDPRGYLAQFWLLPHAANMLGNIPPCLVVSLAD
jgi:hypothetical protein